MNDQIRLNPATTTASLHFRDATALALCTTVEYDDAGVLVRQNWPNLSSGEALLWQTLDWLNGAPNLPSLVDLRAGLDAPNYRAVAELLTSEGAA